MLMNISALLNKLRFKVFSSLKSRRFYKFFFYFLLPIFILRYFKKKGLIFWEDSWEATFEVLSDKKIEFCFASSLLIVYFFTVYFLYKKLTIINTSWEEFFFILKEKKVSVKEGWLQAQQEEYEIFKIENIRFDFRKKDNDLIKFSGKFCLENDKSVFFISSFPNTDSQWVLWRNAIELQSASFFSGTYFREVGTSIFGWVKWIVKWYFFAGLAAIFSYILYEVVVKERGFKKVIKDKLFKNTRVLEREEKELEEKRKKRKKKVFFPKDVEIGFENVGGYENEKKAIKDLCKRIKKGEKIKGGMILYGPPGTGKTMLAKVFAKEVGYPFFFKNGAELQSGAVAAVATNSEQSKLFDLFEEVEDYRSDEGINKIILFIDELDAMGSNFISSAKNQISQTSKGCGTGGEEFKNLMGGGGYTDDFKNIFVIATTNEFEWFSEAATRPGRLGVQYKIGYPDVEGLKAIVRIHVERIKKENPRLKFATDMKVEVIAEEIAKQRKEKEIDFTGADIESLVDSFSYYAEESEKGEFDQAVLEECIKIFIGSNVKFNKKPLNVVDEFRERVLRDLDRLNS